MSRYFRFEGLEIWQEAVLISGELFKIANDLQDKKLWRFADQLRGVGMGIPNNISESTGTDKIGEQTQLLRYSRRECFEAANILVILYNENLISLKQKEMLYHKLYVQCIRTQNYSDALVTRSMRPAK